MNSSFSVDFLAAWVAIGSSGFFGDKMAFLQKI